MLTEEKLSILEKTGSSDVQDLVREVRRLRSVITSAASRLLKAPADEAMRLASEDYCGETLLESGLVCGQPQGPHEFHKASVDMLGVTVLDLRDAVVTTLATLAGA